ncbi:carbonic anhydrase [uncultured Aurantimicrobium sp.]|uniref:carbonic anhydrase n=1 Tax=uncultured Aurantimicrobium sp. TaxID=1705357 RepID=UPI002620E485|nr:carbonic anhydrase family protein [uncultured Aurantimicrobium sp.]
MKTSTTRRLSLAIGLIAAAGLLTGCAQAPAAQPTSWGYGADNGPEVWGSLNKDYALCVDGTAQSPIDIVNTVDLDLVNIELNYTLSQMHEFDNGHTIEAEVEESSKNIITVDGEEYSLVQLHFHAPSEHQIDGQTFPLEVHFVHESADGKLAVIGVFAEEGTENSAWKPFTDSIHTADNTKAGAQVSLNPAELLPAVHTTYRYDGSLTTPNCGEGVKWNVMSNPITMSADQLAQFTSAYDGNNRPVQPVNGREIELDTTP